MHCVWVEAFGRSQRMPTYGHELIQIQPPVNRRLEGTSSWIKILRGVDRELLKGWAEGNNIPSSILMRQNKVTACGTKFLIKQPLNISKS